MRATAVYSAANVSQTGAMQSFRVPEEVHGASREDNKTFLQRVSITCYAKRCISYRKSVCLSVCQTLALCQNDSSFDHAVFTGG